MVTPMDVEQELLHKLIPQVGLVAFLRVFIPHELREGCLILKFKWIFKLLLFHFFLAIGLHQ